MARQPAPKAPFMSADRLSPIIRHFTADVPASLGGIVKQAPVRLLYAYMSSLSTIMSTMSFYACRAQLAALHFCESAGEHTYFISARADGQAVHGHPEPERPSCRAAQDSDGPETRPRHRHRDGLHASGRRNRSAIRKARVTLWAAYSGPKKMVIVFVCVNPRILGSEKPVHISLMVYGTQQYPELAVKSHSVSSRSTHTHSIPLKFFKFFNHIVGKFT